jgi:hypothetical protein
LMPRGSFTGGQQNRLADPIGTSTCHLNTGGGHFSLDAGPTIVRGSGWIRRPVTSSELRSAGHNSQFYREFSRLLPADSRLRTSISREKKSFWYVLRISLEKIEHDRYGLDDVVVQDMAESLAEFDEATARVTRGRMAHVGARAELRVIGQEILVTVKVLNGSNRLRFTNDSEALAAWNSARRVERADRTEGAERAEQAGGAGAAEGPGLDPAA